MTENKTTKPLGWLKIHRDLLSHWCSQDPNFLAVWIRLLLEANFETKKTLINYSPIEVKRGDVIFGLNAFSEKSGVSVSKLRRIMKVLEDEGMIDRQKTNKYSIISITNYDQYQLDDRQNAFKQQSDDIQTTTPKETNNYNNNKKTTPISPSKGKRKTSLSPDFIPSKDNALDFWKKQGRLDLKYSLIADEFLTYCRANAKTYNDWDAAWKTWYCNAVKFQRKDDTVACNGDINPAHAEAMAVHPTQRTPEQWKLLLGGTPRMSYTYWRKDVNGQKPRSFEDMVALYE